MHLSVDRSNPAVLFLQRQSFNRLYFFQKACSQSSFASISFAKVRVAKIATLLIAKDSKFRNKNVKT